jgi:outer membrane biosynthesis protein TonB
LQDTSDEPTGEYGFGLTQDEPKKEEEKKEEPKKEEKPPEIEAEKKKPEPAVDKVKKATDIFDGLRDGDDDDEDKKGDSYYDIDLKSMKLGDIDKEFASMAAEEKDAFTTPLNKKELKKMEASSKSLMGEITTGLDSYGKNKFWRNKKFFREHIGF